MTQNQKIVNGLVHGFLTFDLELKKSKGVSPYIFKLLTKNLKKCKGLVDAFLTFDRIHKNVKGLLAHDF